MVKARQLPPQKGKPLCEGVSEDGRQHPPEVPGYNAGAVGGGDGPKVLGRDALQEVPHPLGRGPVAAGLLVGQLFQLPLPAHPAQGPP